MNDSIPPYQKQQHKKLEDIVRSTPVFGKQEEQNSSLFKNMLKSLENKKGKEDRQTSREFFDRSTSNVRSGKENFGKGFPSSPQENETFAPLHQNSAQRQSTSQDSWGSGAPSSEIFTVPQEQSSYKPTQNTKLHDHESASSHDSDHKKAKSVKGKVYGEHLVSLARGKLGNVNAKAEGASSIKKQIALIEKLSSKILMAQGKDGNATMRLSLNKNLLPGVTLEISHGQGGALNLSFLSSVASSSEFLARFQKEIEQKVMQNTGTSVHVSLSDHGGSGNNAQQRSRGWVDSTKNDPSTL